MADTNIKRESLADLIKMKEKGELFHEPSAPGGEDLGAEFWAKA